jgi:hypothetical protein
LRCLMELGLVTALLFVALAILDRISIGLATLK